MFPSQIRTAIQTLSERLVFLDELLKEPTLKEVRRAKIDQARESVATEIEKNQQELDRLDKAEEFRPTGSKLAQHAPTETTLNKAAETRITQASIGLDSELSDYINGLQSSLQRGPDTQDAKRVTAEIQYLQKMKDLIPTSPEQAQKGLNDLRAVKRIQAKEAAAAAQSAKIAATSESIRFPFNKWSRERLEKGSKTATARTYTFGRTGDTFSVGDKTYEITSVSKKSLDDVSQNYYLKEGAKSPEEYRQVWESLHPGGFEPSQTVYFHEFRELKPGAVPLIPVQQKTAEWFSSRGSILKESREESKGIVSLPRTVFGEKTVGVPHIEGSLSVQRTAEQLEAMRAAKKKTEELEVIRDIKEKNLFVNLGRPGGKLATNDFYEPHIGADGSLYYRSAFFRTNEGTIQYTGNNPRIMPESQLSQATPETKLIDYESEEMDDELLAMVKEKAYAKEQYDRDAILSNKGLPLESDNLRREADRFEKQFVINFFVNHPEKLQPWLDKADPKVIAYLNDVLGGELTLKRKWLPQIEYQGKLHEVADKRDIEYLNAVEYEGKLREAGVEDWKIPVKGDIKSTGLSAEKIWTAAGEDADKAKNVVVYVVDKDIPTDQGQYKAFVERLRTGQESYITRMGEEVDVSAVREPEAGLGMSVSTGIADILNKGQPGGVPKGIKVSDPRIKSNEIRVVRYVKPLQYMADYKPMNKAWEEAISTITSMEELQKAIKNAVTGRISWINDNPSRFGVAQEGEMILEGGEKMRFVSYKKDNPPTLAKNERYVINDKTKTITGSKDIVQITRDNLKIENYPSTQITTTGIVTDVEDVFQTGGTAQYGHMISPEGGRIIKFTTFTRDNPPVLEKGKPYTIYSSFMQGFINNAGEVELNINIKPQNLYKEKGGLTAQQEYFQKELRGSVYTSIVEPIDPGGFKKFTGQPPEPKAVKAITDAAVGTTIEDGKIVVITKSGRRLSAKEYEAEFGIISGNKKLSDLVFDEPELRSKHLTYDQLAAIGLLPTGALELSPSEPQSGTPADPVISTAIENGRPIVVTISGKRMSAEEYYAEDINPLDYNADSQRAVTRKDGAQEISESFTEAYDVSSELMGIWDQKLSEVYPRYLERSADYNKEWAEGTMSPFRKYLPVDVGLTALDVLGTGLYPLAFPSQAYWGTRMGQNPMEGIRKEITPTQALEIENPWAALLADIALDPLNLLAGTGMIGKVRKAESLWEGVKLLAPRNLPEFLRSEEAVIGRKAGVIPSSAGASEAAQVGKQAELTAMEGAVPEQPLKPVAKSAPSDRYEEIKLSNKAKREESKVLREKYEKAKARRVDGINRLKTITDDAEFKKVYNEVVEANKEAASYGSVLTRSEQKNEMLAMLDLGSSLPKDAKDRISRIELSAMGWTEADFNWWDQKQASSKVSAQATKPAPVMVEAPKKPDPVTQTVAPPVSATPLQPTSPLLYQEPKVPVPSEAASALTPEEQAWAEQAWKERAWEYPQGETPVTLKELRRKTIILNKAADDLHPSNEIAWKKAAIGVGVAGIGVGAYTLSQILKNNQQESITAAHGLPTQEFNEFPFSLQNATYPMQYPNVTYPVRMPVVGDQAQLSTAMAVAGDESKDTKDEEKSFLVKVLDALQTASYIEGAAITGAQSWYAGKGLDYEWGVTPSEALGLKKRDESMFDSWSGLFGTALDILADPTTYLSLGTGTAAKVGVKGGVTIALNPRGLKAMKEFTEEAVAKGVSKQEAESMFIDTLSDPAIARRFEPSAGISLRGWGQLSSHEIELVSQAQLAKAKGMPKEQWDAMLRKMATSGNPSIEKAATYLFKAETYIGSKAGSVADTVGTAFKPFYNIRKTVPRPANLPLGESEYAEKFMLFKKGVRYKSDKYFQKYESLREEAKKELGVGYEEIISKYIETPVLIESAGLSPKTRGIISTIQEDMKVFAAEETGKGLLDTSVDAYLKHILTKEAREYLKANKKTGTEVFLPLKSSISSSGARGYKGTIESINEAARTKLGFNLFDPDPFKAAEVRAIESVHAVGQYDFLEYVTKYYGDSLTQVDKAGYAFTKRTPQLMNVLPGDVESEMIAVSKGILRKLEPDQVFTSVTGKTYTSKEILKLADDAKLISERTAGQEARSIVEGDVGKKIVTINPSREEIARVALLADRLLMKGMSPEEAVAAAAKELRNIQIPEAIAEHLEPKMAAEGILDKTLYKLGGEEYSTLDTFDVLQSKWKWLQTVWAPAYHAQNIAGGFWNAGALGETSLQSFIDSVRILGRSEKTMKNIVKAASGEERSGAELIEMAGEHGVFGQPGWMDIEQKLNPLEDDSVLSKVSKGSLGKVLSVPGNVARQEENWMRFSVFLDRWKKGDTPEEAANYAAKYLIEYMPEAYTEFERAYLLRLFPFYKYPRSNIPLQMESLVTQPGKIATLDKVSNRGEYSADWNAGSLVLPAEDPLKFTAIPFPVEQLKWFNDPALQTLMRTSPLVKAPLESIYHSPWAGGAVGVYDRQNITGPQKPSDYGTGLVGTQAYIDPYGRVYPAAPYGASFFDQKPYTSATEPYTSNLIGRPLSTAGALGSDKPVDEKVLKFITSANTNIKPAPQTQAELRQAFTGAQARMEDATYQQKFEAWQRDKMVSPLSGIPDEIQIGHILPAALGGKAEMSNLMVQTREENYENLAAQTFMENVPEKEFLQEQFWTEVQEKYTTDLTENLKGTEEKLNAQGMVMNEAIQEKVAYDARKKGNTRLYTKELAKIRMQLDWAERQLRKELRSLETKKQRPGFKGDPVSERQILKLNYFISKYQNKYDEIERLREEERAKVFELPEQILRGEFSLETLDNPIVVKGKGPELAEPDKIINMVKFEDLAFDRAYIMEYLPVIDLKRYLDVNAGLMEGKDAIKQPTGEKWLALQTRAKETDIELFGPALSTPVMSTPVSYFKEGSRESETLGMSIQGYADYVKSLKETNALAPGAVVPTTAVPTIQYPGNVTWNTTIPPDQFQGNINRTPASVIFNSLGLDIDTLQKKGDVGYVDNALDLSEGVPIPYTRSGWMAKLAKDREAQSNGVFTGTKVSPGVEGMEVTVERGQEFDEDTFLESPNFIAAVESIATRLYDDQIYS